MHRRMLTLLRRPAGSIDDAEQLGARVDRRRHDRADHLHGVGAGDRARDRRGISDIRHREFAAPLDELATAALVPDHRAHGLIAIEQGTNGPAPDLPVAPKIVWSTDGQVRVIAPCDTARDRDGGR